MEKELLFFSYDVFGIPFVDPVRGVRPGDAMARWNADEGSVTWPDPCPAPDVIPLAAGHMDT